MTETTIVVQIVLALITSGVVSGAVTYYVRRDANRTKVRITEIEAARAEKSGDTATNAGLLTVATTAIQMLEPFRNTLEKLASVVTQSVTINESLIQRADEMHLVVEQRNLDAKQDRETSATRYKDIVTRLDKYQSALDSIAREVTVNTNENTLRHQFSLALLLMTEISKDTKRLIERDLEKEGAEAVTPPANEPGEVNDPAPELSSEQKEGKASE